MIQKIKSITLALLAGAVVACSGDDDSAPPTATLTLDTIGLEALTGGTSYQGWLVVEGKVVPTEKFTDPAGKKTFTLLASDLEKATEFSITIEPVGDSDNTPSKAKILKGTFSGNSAQLDFNSVVGNLSNTSGEFFLDTPTDTDPSNQEFGIWFMKGSGAGLVLPELGEGWRYEGWVAFDNVTVSTGTFSKVDVTDDANFFKGSGGTVPTFPGEDFLVKPSQIPLTGIIFPASVVGKKVYITVEPYEDNDPKPFFIKPLSGTAGLTVGSNNPVQMSSNNAVPTGRVTR
ncbi:anti-sigma factor [Aquimarina hainanensis]|uniref:Anti-sigma factor n=1 Tax=Aquimarina hainanensis TaxID=1578017 RepID=A0ABW5NBM6_9FLAO|nr:anti-sigma factor [Aquimarina sp. TRL1]QKX06564.1 anti-sigma factor [Aquimarina sp. TRL1]